MITKTCGTCSKEKPLGEFYLRHKGLNPGTLGNRRGDCKACMRQVARLRPRRTPTAKQRERVRKRGQKYSKLLKYKHLAYLVKMLGKQCCRCRYARHPAAFRLRAMSVEPRWKDINTKLRRPLSELKQELLDKPYRLYCANCWSYRKYLIAKGQEKKFNHSPVALPHHDWDDEDLEAQPGLDEGEGL